MKPDSPFVAKCGHELAIPVGFRTTELKIHMCNLDMIASAKKEIEHNHRIESSANRKQNGVAFSTKTMLFNVLYKARKHGSKISFIYFCGLS
jgi:hypothetical protein